MSPRRFGVAGTASVLAIASVAAAVACTGVVLACRQIVDTSTSIANHGRVLGNVLARSSEHGLAVGDASGLENVLGSLAGDPDLVRVRVADRHGSELASKGLDPEGSGGAVAATAPAQGWGSALAGLAGLESPRLLAVRVPICDRGAGRPRAPSLPASSDSCAAADAIGEVEVVLTTRRAVAQARRAAGVTAGAAAAVALFGAMLFVGAARRVAGREQTCELGDPGDATMCGPEPRGAPTLRGEAAAPEPAPAATEVPARTEGEFQRLQAIGALAGGLAHDFNNLLLPILAYGSMVLEELPDGSKARRRQTAIVQSARQAQELIGQLGHLCQPEEARKGALLLGPLVKETAKRFGTAVPSHLQVEHSVDLNAPMVCADPVQVHQVVVGLLGEAAREAAETPGVIRVKVSPVDGPLTGVEAGILAGGEAVCLSVGTEPEGGMAGPTGGPMGCGEDLAAIRRAVADHGGAFTIAGAPDGRRAFRVYLPVFASELPDEEERKRGDRRV